MMIFALKVGHRIKIQSSRESGMLSGVQLISVGFDRSAILALIDLPAVLRY